MPEEVRRRYVIGAVKIPAADRDIARSVMPDDESVTERAFTDVLGADCPDDDGTWPVGSHTAYALELTEAEAARFAAASNARYVETDHVRRPL